MEVSASPQTHWCKFEVPLAAIASRGMTVPRTGVKGEVGGSARRCRVSRNDGAAHGVKGEVGGSARRYRVSRNDGAAHGVKGEVGGSARRYRVSRNDGAAHGGQRGKDGRRRGVSVIAEPLYRRPSFPPSLFRRPVIPPPTSGGGGTSLIPSVSSSLSAARHSAEAVRRGGTPNSPVSAVAP